MTRREIRETIFQLLFMEKLNKSGDGSGNEDIYLGEMKEGLLEDEGSIEPGSMTESDEAYIRRKTAAVTDKIPFIDGILNSTSRGWKTTRMSSSDLCVLRLAVYEILFDEDIPTGVAINEAVDIARKYGGEDSGSFVNGILGTVASKADELRSDAENRQDASSKADGPGPDAGNRPDGE